MEPESPLIGPLLEKAEAYGKTSIELLKLRSVDATADILSGLAARALWLLALLMFILIAGVAVALWLGKLWGEVSLGFLAVSGIYAFTFLLFFLLRKRIKAGVNNSMIHQLSERLCKK